MELAWDTPSPQGSAADASWGGLLASVRGVPIWGDLSNGKPQPARWTWVDLLEELAARWPALHLEEGWPAGTLPESPAEFAIEARRAVERCSETDRVRLENTLFEFRQRHDLSRGLHGLSLPEFWVVREGTHAWVGSTRATARLPFGIVADELAKLGDTIASRLSALDDERARQAVLAWKLRAETVLVDVVSVGTGLGPDDLTFIASDGLEKTFELLPGSLEPTELLAAARMAAPAIPPATLRLVLRSVRAIPHRKTPELDALSALAMADRREWAAERSFTEGYQLARWFRSRIGLSEKARVEPESILDGWGVRVKELDLKGPGVDAVACWGPRHGPAILLNVSGRHAKSRAGRRSTLAHEIDHLLVDRQDALPLSEVAGGLVPLAVERRARAFAAELLLPRQVAADALLEKALESSVKSLCVRFGVSRELVAWQIHNSARPLTAASRRFLQPLVSSPWQFSLVDWD